MLAGTAWRSWEARANWTGGTLAERGEERLPLYRADPLQPSARARPQAGYCRGGTRARFRRAVEGGPDAAHGPTAPSRALESRSSWQGPG